MSGRRKLAIIAAATFLGWSVAIGFSAIVAFATEVLS